MAAAVRRLTWYAIGTARFHFRVVAPVGSLLNGCPPLRHSITARGRTEADGIGRGMPFQ